jgi:hypothetical protein
MPQAFWRRVRRRDVLLIGTNRVLCFQATRGAAWDVLVIRDTYRSLWRDQRWGERYHEEMWKPAAAHKVGPADRRFTYCDEFVRQVDGWQFEPALDENGEAAVMKNPSVVLMAANWAWLRGCRQIFLVGVDYRGGHAAMVPPYSEAETGWAGQYDGPGPAKRIERYFRRATEAAASAGGEILNLSPGSALRSVPRASWRDVLSRGGDAADRCRGTAQAGP